MTAEKTRDGILAAARSLRLECALAGRLGE
jgi:hypothetical protein